MFKAVAVLSRFKRLRDKKKQKDFGLWSDTWRPGCHSVLSSYFGRQLHPARSGTVFHAITGYAFCIFGIVTFWKLIHVRSMTATGRIPS